MTYSLYFINILLLLILFSNAKKLSLKLNLYKKKINHTPIVGGLGIYTFFILNILCLYFLNNQLVYDYLYVVILMSLIFIIGLIDDIFDISYAIRLVLIFFIIFIFLKLNNTFLVNRLYFETINKTFILGELSYFLTPLFIMLLLNSLNMVDGINGNSGLIFLSFFIIIFENKSDLNYLLFIVSTAIIIFLFFNLKNLLYMGDSGIYLISIFISLYLIDSYNQNYSNLSCEKIFLILMIPGIDMFRLFCKRIYNKRNPFKGDTNHLHHVLIKKFKLHYSLTLYVTLILWPFVIIKLIDIQIAYLIVINLIFYTLLIFKLNIKN